MPFFANMGVIEILFCIAIALLWYGIGYIFRGKVKYDIRNMSVNDEKYNLGLKFWSLIDTDFNNPQYVRKTRKQLLSFIIVLAIIIFALAFLSFGALRYFLIVVWILFLGVLFNFSKVWKYHGYSILVLVSILVIIIVLSFLITAPIREYIIKLGRRYLHSR